ncbi:MAG: hypothetical protein HONBIEJF_00390 [Fimbriimonadaceae bacterium]|nr:hypothetical protein [Fimbriimonadaceae bacterium]
MRAAAKTLWILSVGVAMGGGATYLAMRQPLLSRTETYGLQNDILVHGNTDLNEIAITIDDGPRPESTSRILDILKEHRVRATFFVVGKQVAKHPELVRRMMSEGHEVGNHTYTHRRLTELTEEEVRTEIGSCHRAIQLATGVGSALFRPPGMRFNERILQIAQELGYVTIHWNSAVEDYSGNSNIQPVSTVSKRLADSDKGSVILIHGHPTTIEALPTALVALKARGTRFVTVSQMLGRLPRPVYVKSNAYQTVPLPKPAASVATKARPKPKAGKRPMIAQRRRDPIESSSLPAQPAIDIAADN